MGSTEMNEELHQAANKFLDVKMNKEAAKCLRNGGQLELATEDKEQQNKNTTQHVLVVLCIPMLTVSLDCPLFIVPSVFSNV
jgi:hypothetical protein